MTLPYAVRAAATAALATLAAGCSALGTWNPPTAPTSPTSAPVTTATSRAPAATSTPPTTPAPQPVTVRLASSGDQLPHVPVRNSAERYAGSAGSYDFVPMFAEVTPFLSAADLAICHLETPISATNKNLSVPRQLSFNSPREFATALGAAGFDGCGFASNHSWDRGVEGLKQTVDVVTKAGLTYAGPTGDATTSGEPGLYSVNGTTLAHLAYSYTALNTWGPNTDVPPSAPWLAKTLWPVRKAEGILDDVAAARAAGARFVVVSMHWGAEYVTKPTRDQRDLAKDLLESGEVDLILGSHAHVLQPCEEINGRLVFYGLGNALSNQGAKYGLLPETQEGVLVEVTLTSAPDGTLTTSAVYQPTRVDLDGHVIELTGPDHLPKSAERTTRLLNGLGAGSCPATLAR